MLMVLTGWSEAGDSKAAAEDKQTEPQELPWWPTAPAPR